jgi:hypothetical protein
MLIVVKRVLAVYLLETILVQFENFSPVWKL